MRWRQAGWLAARAMDGLWRPEGQGSPTLLAQVLLFPTRVVIRGASDGLRLYTINGAYGTFEEDIKGTIGPGKLVDMVVLADDLLTAPEEQIRLDQGPIYLRRR